MSRSFVSEQIGIMSPGNDVMSAIVSLFIEVFSYGILISSIILFLLCYIIDNFTHDVENIEAKYLSEFTPYNVTVRTHSNAVLFIMYIISFFCSFVEKKASSNNVLHPNSFKKEHESFLDICFLFFPTMVVILMLVPTLGFLYNNHFALYNVLDTSISIDVIGHQWYWSYEYHLGGEYNDFMFDSILDIDASFNANLEVDFRVVIPTDLLVRITVTSTDVIHSWAVPNLGVKVDAIPGRLTNSTLFTFVDGVYYGQCSELCGVLHGFMPICVEAVPADEFFAWATVQGNFFAKFGNYFNQPAFHRIGECLNRGM